VLSTRGVTDSCRAWCCRGTRIVFLRMAGGVAHMARQWGPAARDRAARFVSRPPKWGRLPSWRASYSFHQETNHGGMEPVRVPGQLEPVPATRAPSLAWLETEDEKTPTSPHFCLSSGARSSERAPPLSRTLLLHTLPGPAPIVPPEESAASADSNAPKGRARPPTPRGERSCSRRKSGATTAVQRILAL
jgi:hypothetical protein